MWAKAPQIHSQGYFCISCLRCDVQKLRALLLHLLKITSKPCPCLFLPMIPCNAATSWTLLKMSPSTPPLPPFLQLPKTPSDRSKRSWKTLFSFFKKPSQAPPFVPLWWGEGRKSRLTGASIHTPKSAKAGRWHRQKNNKSLPIRGRGSATLYLWRQNKGRPVERSDCVYFRGGTMPLRGGSKDWCGTWGPHCRNSTSFWFTVSLRKQL